MYKIGVIGRRDAVLGFLTLGFSVFEEEGLSAAADRLRRMVRSGEYGVILIQNSYAEGLREQMEAYSRLPIPAIVSIPD